MSENDKYELPKDEKDHVQEAALLTIIKRYADFHGKICKEIGVSGGWSQCSREYNGKQYRVIVAEYEHCPVAELTRLLRALAGRDPEKLEGLLKCYSLMYQRLLLSDEPINGFLAECHDALVAFEGRANP